MRKETSFTFKPSEFEGISATGFDINYKNGLTASVKLLVYDKRQCEENKDGELISFEIAVFDDENNFITNSIFNNSKNGVVGYVPIDKLDVYLRKIKNFTKSDLDVIKVNNDLIKMYEYAIDISEKNDLKLIPGDEIIKNYKMVKE